ncbi:MAG TPA: co-chaperone GroES, partial [Promineifilum sp.]|nr:co-chaperone GroES [Promineifilum sp.]
QFIFAGKAHPADENGKRIEMDVEVGDIVLYAKYGGTEVKIDDKKLLILKESDVLAIVGN